jgi:alpha-ribazole phosphatase
LVTEAKTNERLRLYLIRHGEVEGAKSGRVLGWTDSPLSERGLEQSRQVTETLASSELSAVYSSDLQRARLMAEKIAEHHHLNAQANQAWREINMGEWEGRTIASLHDQAPSLVAQLFDDPVSFEYPRGESFAVFIGRVQTALQNLLATHGAGEIALVAHGGVCRTIIGSALGMPAKNWLRVAQDYGCLNVIDWYGESPVLRLLNRRPALTPLDLS